MLKGLNSTIIIALCTSAALIAFAFDQRYRASVTMPDVAFYVAAAIICLLPVFLRPSSPQSLSKQRIPSTSPRITAEDTVMHQHVGAKIKLLFRVVLAVKKDTELVGSRRKSRRAEYTD